MNIALLTHRIKIGRIYLGNLFIMDVLGLVHTYADIFRNGEFSCFALASTRKRRFRLDGRKRRFSKTMKCNWVKSIAMVFSDAGTVYVSR